MANYSIKMFHSRGFCKENESESVVESAMVHHRQRILFVEPYLNWKGTLVPVVGTGGRKM